MVKKRASSGKRHYILHDMNKSLLVFAVSFTPNFGTLMESRTPLEDLKKNFNFCFLTVYIHIFQI